MTLRITGLALPISNQNQPSPTTGLADSFIIYFRWVCVWAYRKKYRDVQSARSKAYIRVWLHKQDWLLHALWNIHPSLTPTLFRPRTIFHSCSGIRNFPCIALALFFSLFLFATAWRAKRILHGSFFFLPATLFFFFFLRLFPRGTRFDSVVVPLSSRVTIKLLEAERERERAMPAHLYCPWL